MVLAERWNDRIAVESQFRDRELIKRLPNSLWNADARIWTVPLSWAACKQLRTEFGSDLQVGPQLTEWAREEYGSRVSPVMVLRPRLELDADPDLLGDDNLFPFQRVGARILVLAKRGLLADDMGAGKTVQTLVALRRLDALPALVICPNTVKRNWAREAAEWFPEADAVVLKGTAPQRRKQFETLHERSLLICNYDQLRSHSRLGKYGSIEMTAKEKTPAELNGVKWAAVITDEAHKLKDPKAKQTRAAWAVAHQQDCYRFALTGTPIANHLGDLWGLLHFVAPEEHPTKTKYLERYTLNVMNEWSGGLDVLGINPHLKDEFFEILDPRFLRRPKEVILPQLPPKTYERREVELAPKERKAYVDMEEQQIARLENGTIAAPNPLAVLTRLSQFCCAYATLEGEEKTLRLTEPSSKLDALDEVLDEMGNEQVVVAAESRQIIELSEARMEKRGISFASVRGGINELQRDRNVQDFQDGRVRVMFITLGAGGLGLTLTAASTIVFLNRSWSMVNNKQAEDRIHRIGQTAEKVTVLDILAVDTIEDERIERLKGKEASLEEITRDKDTLVAYLKDRRRKK